MHYHIGFSCASFSDEIDSVILTGDPDRASYIAEHFFHSAKLLSEKRGLSSFEVEHKNGRKLLVCTSGMGGPSTSIVVNELAKQGIKKIIRVGTSGAIADRVKTGDLVITKASLCEQGAANDIVPESYPAAADPFLTVHLCEKAKEMGMAFHLGLTASVDTFYEGQERVDSSFNKALLPRHIGKTELYRALQILNFEMESGTLFKQCLAYGIQAACVCAIIAQRNESEQVDQSVKQKAVDQAIRLAVAEMVD